MDSPTLEWTLTATSTWFLDVLNTISAAMALATWRRPSLVRAREHLASALGMGRLRLTGTMPSGHIGTLMPGRMYYIDDSQAMLGGADLGHPARLPANPTIGEITLPARGVLATGQAMWQILDQAGPLDGVGGVAAGVAASAQGWPDGRIQQTLHAAQRWRAGADMFQEEPLAARAQNAVALAERRMLVGDATQDKGGDRAVEGGVTGGEFIGDAVADLDRHRACVALRRAISRRWGLARWPARG